MVNTVNFDFYVQQGTYGIVSVTQDKTLLFGTGGLASCVGIIAQLTNNRIFCGHMDSEYDPMNEEQKVFFISQVQQLLKKSIPCDDVIPNTVYFCSIGRFKSTKAIKDTIKDVFQSANDKGEFCSLYINTKTCEITADILDHQDSGKQVNNGAFRILKPKSNSTEGSTS